MEIEATRRIKVQTVEINIKDAKTAERFFWLLEHFKKDELEVKSRDNTKKEEKSTLLELLKATKAELPKDYRFDREEANAR